MENLLRDARFSTLILLKTPAFTAVAVLSLALGIGANTTIFSVVNAILLRPLPFKQPDRLVTISERNREKNQGSRNPRLSTAIEWREKTRSFAQVELAVPYTESTTLSGQAWAEQVIIQFLDRDCFSLLGSKPILGQTFPAGEVIDNTSRNILISHGFWQRRFGGDQKVIGQTLIGGDGPWTIVGIMPPGYWIFPWAKDADVFSAVSLTKNKLTPETRWFSVLARLKPDATLAQAQAEMDVFARRIEQQYPQTNKGWDVKVEPLQQYLFRGWGDVLYLLLGTVGFVLLIACANVANLLLARAAMRQKEIAIRASLGAGRWRLIQQLLTESVVLAVVSGLLGILVSLAGIRIFVALAPEWFPRAEEIGIDFRVLGFTLGVSLLTGILFGLAPAWKASRPDLTESLKEGGRSSGGELRQYGRSLLVVSEVALAMVLLIGAGLMINSFLRLRFAEPGYNPRNLLTAQIQLDGPRYRELLEGDMKRVTPRVDIFFEQVLERLQGQPGVEAAAVASRFPMQRAFRIIGRPEPPTNQQPVGAVLEVTAGYFSTMQVPLRRGRTLTEGDNQSASWVVVVNDTLAKRYFPDEDPIGKTIQLKFGDTSGVNLDENKPREIIGVVGSVKYWGLSNDPPPALYVPYRQHMSDYPGGTSQTRLGKTLLLRTKSDPMHLAGAVRRVVAEADKDQPVSEMTSMEQTLSEWLAPQRFAMQLFGIFAALAVILAVVGIYGVMSYSVSRRTHEIGLRLALGAERDDVLKLVLRRGLKLSLIGVAIGIAGALAMTRLVSGFLYGVKASDPLTFAAVSLLLILVALAASYIPARRATTVDPMAALRYE
ncbi:MAG TPA: ABC transporter permease [Bryobacteraceae bacterium]|nr:ABC transporter permease [Bryobacteraceae bacterium]